MDGDLLGKVAEAQRLAAELRAEAVSEDRAVRVVAGPGGEVKEIDLRMNAFELSGLELGEVTAALVREATAKADRELGEAIRRSVAGLFAAEREERR